MNLAIHVSPPGRRGAYTSNAGAEGGRRKLDGKARTGRLAFSCQIGHPRNTCEVRMTCPHHRKPSRSLFRGKRLERTTAWQPRTTQK